MCVYCVCMRVANVCVYCVCMRRRNWPRCLSNSRRVFMIQCNDQSVCMGVNVCVYCVCVCMYVCVCVIVFVFVLVCQILWRDNPMYTKATHPTECMLLVL